MLVYKLDRLTRSVRDLDELLRNFDRQGIMFRSATEQFDTTTATGRLFIRMVAEMAQWERETIAERTTFGKQKKARAGEWGGGRVPMGYMTVPTERVKAGRALLQLVPDPSTAHLIPMIYERYLAGEGIRAIALWLNEELGARTPLGNKFHALTISRILTNPVYCGDIVTGRKQNKINTRVPGSHEPLVPRDVLERVQSLFDTRKLYAPRQATGMYPLSGVAKCGVCGARISAQQRHGRPGRRIYRCHRYVLGEGCGVGTQRSLTSISADRVEENLIREMERLHRDPAHLDRLLEEFEARAADKAGLTQAEVSRMEQDLVEAENAINRWKRLFERGKIDEDEYLDEVKPHRERLKTLKTKLSEYKERAVQLLQRDLPGGFAINFRESWEELTPPERKALLQRFVQAFGLDILIHPDRSVTLRSSL